ncbi:RsmE family RNA methyltransferase [Ereboglobus luteus]|uniref:Ribosomal RNA small subunit methyltransferase E n=1 Tax=Ereboglobus luteus TaxID=1796921 RepID=A0A2U8E3R6_9BACT|nr:RsmE family RNA methyltransferase [Ereboglobus luteus]AWI09405.1 16S rRNA methyltransferase [Ereboglobus luteus]
MPDFRSYCPSPADAANATELLLSAEESHHLVAVNRARRGDPVIAFDGHGREWTCELARDSKNAAVLKVLSSRQAAAFPFRITLAQALPKGPSMDAIVRKATEIGAARIVPLESERTQVHFDSKREDKKTDKWRVAALEAAKQCGNPWLPEIQPVQNATAFMRASATPGAGYDLRLIASLHEGARTLKTILADFRAAHENNAPRNVLWLIGPEGDFSPAEMDAARGAAIEPVTLGPLVLRCETAAVYALSILSYELQNM